MAAAHSDDAVWQVVKRHNAFVRKGLNGAVFSAEPYNLYNLHNKRYSGTACLISVSSPGLVCMVPLIHVLRGNSTGLANSRAIDVQPGTGKETKLGIRRKNKHNQPKHANAQFAIKRHNKRQRKAVVRAARSVRPDLADAAARRASAVHKVTRNQTAAQKAEGG
jgi:large subunit ribosomal protein L28e